MFNLTPAEICPATWANDTADAPEKGIRPDMLSAGTGA